MQTKMTENSMAEITFETKRFVASDFADLCRCMEMSPDLVLTALMRQAVHDGGVWFREYHFGSN